MVGITSFGAYIPRLRLDRMAIFQSMGWFAPATVMVAQGERSMCNWDEDSLTMAVAASRDCLAGVDKTTLDGLYLASTTLPFADRQNAGIVATALNLKSDILASDFTASQKAGTGALIAALDAVKAGDRRQVLVAAADRREAKAAYFYEMWFGDGAASLCVGSDNVIAEFLGSHAVSYDFVDHYRASGKTYDYMWEERWARDEGYAKIIPEAVNGLLKKLNIGMDAVDHLVFPCFFKAEHRKIARLLGADQEKVADNLHEVCGETGAAHSLVMLCQTLERARPGDRILVAGFGQGCNVLYFKVTDRIADRPARTGVSGCLKQKKTIDNYPKFLKFRNLIQTEMGIRAEAPTQTAMTALWRKRQMLLGLVGGYCETCGTPQFPKTDICVNPACGAMHTQIDYEFADQPAVIKTFTADLLAVSVDPPHCYGMVQFDGGGRMMADFTDCTMDDLKVGLPMRMVFRKRSEDPERGFVNYFWKATPLPGARALMNRIRFDGQVAVVTGAGGGLGRVYALELAQRGAQVVVNDFGGARDGSGDGSASPADRVVAEIQAAGGRAAANYDNVATAEGGENIIRTAVEAFGGVDIVINNAGILRDKSFTKMEPENWDAVMAVHLNGAFHVTRPAFALMKERGYGRVVMTTSAAGLYGNFGQANYSAAKMALVGLMNTLKLEGAKYDIRVNTVAPLAASRLTEDILPPDMFARMKPELVAPLVVYLCSDRCQETGAIFNAGMGYVNRAAFMTGPGTVVGDDMAPPTPELIHQHWDAINAMEGAKELPDLTSALMDLMAPAPQNEAARTTVEPSPDAALNVAAVFEKMPAAFIADAAAGIDVVFQYCISGPEGGDWAVAVKDRTCTVTKGLAEKATCTLRIRDADFVRLISGELPAMQAYTSGKLKIEGDIMKSQLIEKLFSMKA